MTTPTSGRVQAHHAEAWRRGYEPRVEFGWHCLTCGQEGTAFSATVAENLAAAHIRDTTPGRASSPLLTVEEWTEDIEEGRDPDEWPYPTTYTRSLAQGELAERIRRALGAADDLPVYVVEEVISTGYSEYTQEDEYNLTITAGDAEHKIDYGWTGGLQALLRWLDKAAPVEEKP